MCGRYTLASPGDLAGRWAVPAQLAPPPRFNVAPTDPVLTVRADGPALLRWGLVPHWAASPAVGAQMINARAETVAEKPAFRDLFARRRCLVLADGFYEWERRPGGVRAPHHITLADGGPFAFAGLHASWRAPDGSALETCTIVTTTASPRLDPIHPRMPVILPDEDAEEAWLAPDAPPALLHELLQPLPDRLVRAREVSPVVGDARHDAPDCLDDPPPPAAPTLL